MKYQGRRWGPAVFGNLRVEIRDDVDPSTALDSPDSPDSPGSPDSPDSPKSFSGTIVSQSITFTSLAISSTQVATTTAMTTIQGTTSSESSTLTSTTATTLVFSSTTTALAETRTQPAEIAATSGPGAALDGAAQPQTSDGAQSSGEGMSDNAKAGIALGTIFGTAILAGLLFFLFRWRKRRYSMQYQIRYGSGFTDGTGPGQPQVRTMPDKTESAILSDMMTAAHQAENGNILDGYADEKERQAQYYALYDGAEVQGGRPPSIAARSTVTDFLRRPMSMSARTEATTARTADGELLSLYARSSRGLSWFHKSPSKASQELQRARAAAYPGKGSIITGPVPGRLGSPHEPSQIQEPNPTLMSTSRRQHVASIAATEKTSGTATTESTWNTWGVENRRETRKMGVVERWLNKGG